MKTSLVVLSTLVLTVLAGCVISGKPPVEDSKEPLRIGWIGPLSTDAAIIGEENLRGVHIAVDEINASGGIDGKQVQLVVADDQFDEKQTISAYQKMTQADGVKYIMPITYGGFLSLADRAAADNVVLLEALDTSEEFANLGPSSFAVGIYDESIGYAIGEYLTKQGAQNVGLIINSTDPLTALIEQSLREKYIGPLRKQGYTDATDFRSTLTKLAESDYLVFIGWEETGRIVRQARELGLTQEIVGFDTFAGEDFRQNTNGNYDGLVFSFWEGAEGNPVFVKLLETYRAKHQKDPENVLFMTTGYDATKVLAEALHGCEEQDCVREQLKGIKNFSGAAGTITMDADQITRSIREAMFRYEGEAIVPIQ